MMMILLILYLHSLISVDSFGCLFGECGQSQVRRTLTRFGRAIASSFSNERLYRIRECVCPECPSTDSTAQLITSIPSPQQLIVAAPPPSPSRFYQQIQYIPAPSQQYIEAPPVQYIRAPPQLVQAPEYVQAPPQYEYALPSQYPVAPPISKRIRISPPASIPPPPYPTFPDTSDSVRRMPQRKKETNDCDEMKKKLDRELIKKLSNKIVSRNSTDNACNNSELRRLITKNMRRTSEGSKSSIAMNLMNEMKSFVVICSRNNISFISTGMDYCSVYKENLYCYAFME